MRLLLLLSLVSLSLAAVAIYPIKAGQQLVLDLGPNIKTWIRSREEGKGNEYLKYCGPTEKGPRCAQFVYENNKPAKPESEAKVFENGTLVIDNIKKSDAGGYFSNDEMERITPFEGGYAKTARSRINVIVN